MSRNVLISDPTLRDGNHAVRHQLNRASFVAYCQAAEAAGVPIVEVGHGNGLGASSMLVGECALPDEEILAVSRENLHKSKLGIHVIPGFCTIRKDLAKAIDMGVDVVRVASHCTEADITDRHIAYTRQAGKEAFGVLMMSHMASPAILLEEARKMESYGAEAIIIMDSAGAYFPAEVRERISTLVDGLTIPVGFHAHNNLGMAIINSVEAVNAGASIIDGTIRGFGAGAGNAQLEVIVAVFQRLGFETGIDLYRILDAADVARAHVQPGGTDHHAAIDRERPLGGVLRFREAGDASGQGLRRRSAGHLLRAWPAQSCGRPGEPDHRSRARTGWRDHGREADCCPLTRSPKPARTAWPQRPRIPRSTRASCCRRLRLPEALASWVLGWRRW